MGNPKKTRSLEELLSLYEKRTSGESAFAKYLAENALSAERVKNEGVRAASAAYERALPTYGVTAEKLAGKGLSGGGYSDYLAAAAYAARQSAEENAREAYADEVRKNRAGFGEYVENRQKTVRAVVKELNARCMTDTDTMRAYAKAAGLDDDTADLVAGIAADMYKDSPKQMAIGRRSDILGRAISMNLPYETTYRYAIACGYSDEIAKEIAEAANEALTNNNRGPKYRY